MWGSFLDRVRVRMAAEGLDVVEGYGRASRRIWAQLQERPPVFPFVSADILREAHRIGMGNVAAPVVRTALIRGEPLPSWMAAILTDKLLAGVRGFLKLAALRAPEVVPTSLLQEGDRLDRDACWRSAERYVEWLHAG